MAPHARLAPLARALAALGLALASGDALGSEPQGRRPWYRPDHALVQLAGNVGFLSPGLGWTALRGRLEGDVLFGWVPEAVGGSDVLSATVKLVARPFAAEVGDLVLRPLTLGLQVTYTFGDRYFVDPPSRFPGSYYEIPTAVRTGIAVGAGADVRVGRRRVGAYLELVALDLMLRAWAENPRTFGPREVFSMALGVRAEI